MLELRPGDYVLATKYADGDPGDQFAIGFFSGMLPKLGGDRYLIADGEGKQYRGNGFRRCEKISHQRGMWLAARVQDIEAGTLSVWDWAEMAPA